MKKQILSLLLILSQSINAMDNISSQEDINLRKNISLINSIMQGTFSVSKTVIIVPDYDDKSHEKHIISLSETKNILNEISSFNTMMALDPSPERHKAHEEFMQTSKLFPKLKEQMRVYLFEESELPYLLQNQINVLNYACTPENKLSFVAKEFARFLNEKQLLIKESRISLKDALLTEKTDNLTTLKKDICPITTPFITRYRKKQFDGIANISSIISVHASELARSEK